MTQIQPIIDLKEKTLSRIRRVADFPVMSSTINLISRISSTEDASFTELANIIIKDYGLTTKLLKLLNSVGYMQFGEVTTVSRAIMLIGLRNTRNIAHSLMLFEQFQKRTPNSRVTDLLVKSVYSGVLAQNISNSLNMENQQEIFICSLFHSLGELLLAHYLPSDYARIREIGRGTMTENAAARVVTGMTYEELGRAIAGEWHFPERIIHCMRRVKGSEVSASMGEMDTLGCIVTISNEISDIIANNADKQKRAGIIESYLLSFPGKFKTLVDTIDGMLKSATGEMVEYCSAYNVDYSNSTIVGQFLNIAGPVAAGDLKAALSLSLDTDITGRTDSLLDVEEISADENIFSKAVRDINVSILNGYPLNDTMRIILETIYRGMLDAGISRTLFFIKDAALPEMNLRVAFGDKPDAPGKWSRIPIGAYKDIFNMALRWRKEVVVRNSEAPDIKTLLPGWFMKHITSPIFFIILPIVIEAAPIGLIYIEGERENFGKVTREQVNYLKIMRTQAAIAVRQK